MRRVLLATVTVLLGCAPPRDEPGALRHSLVVAYASDEFPLALNRDRLARYPLNAGVCEPLVRLAPDFTVAPALATRWESRAPNQVRFILEPGIAFSDGGALDAHAVAATLSGAARAHTDYSFLSDSSVRVVDDTTLDITPARVNRRLVEQLVHPTYAVVSPQSDPARNPVCTGAFRLAEYVAHNHLTVVRNERYRGARARMDTIVFRFIPDETTRVLALRAGEVDAIADVRPATAAALAGVAGVQVSTAPPGAVLVMYINLNGTAPFAQMRDAALRRAVAMSIDRHLLVDRVIGGGPAAMVNTVNPPVVLGTHAALVQGVAYDTTAARRLLRGGRRSLRMIANPGAVDRSVVEFVQAQLRLVGIDVITEQLDAAAYETRLNSGAFDLDLEGPSQNDANPSFLLALRWYSRSNTKSVRFTHASARYDTLVDRALMATTDDEARETAADAMHQLVDVEVGAVPLAGISRIYAMGQRVHGFAPHPSRLNQDWSTVWLAR